MKDIRIQYYSSESGVRTFRRRVVILRGVVILRHTRAADAEAKRAARYTAWQKNRTRDARAFLLAVLEREEEEILVQHVHAEEFFSCVSSRRETAYREVIRGASLEKLRGLDRPRISVGERLRYTSTRLGAIDREKTIVQNLPIL